ncbi:MAG: lipopolysaccharide heptosyltransferase II [Bacteroidetes bacterium]|nr:lipopolysaccharide heptosyltransferase II [Bacteroidota bacterium]
MTDGHRILIFHTAFVGDLVLTLPVAQSIRTAWPAAYVAVVAIPAAASVLRGHPAIDEVVAYDKKGRDSGIGGFLRLVRELKSLKPDSAVVPHRSLRSALAVWCARIPRRIGFATSAGRWLLNDVVPDDRAVHETRRNLALLSPLGISAEEGVRPRLFPSADDARAVDRLVTDHESRAPGFGRRTLVALAPGSVWFTKRWPGEYFAHVASALARDGVGVVLIGGPDDQKLCGEITEACVQGVPVLDASGKLSLLQSAELMRRCRVTVTNDSAPLHLAGGVGTPVIALFGATVPAFGFGPLGPRDRVLEVHGLQCKPCAIHGGPRCPIKTFVCMRNLLPSRVLDAVHEFLSHDHREV